MKFNSKNIGLIFETIIADRDKYADDVRKLELHSNILVNSLNKTSKKVRDLECRIKQLEVELRFKPTNG